MRPLQALAGVQRRERDDVLVGLAALGQAQDHADGLRDVEHALRLGLHLAAAVLGDLAAAAPRDPVDEVEHVGPARRRDLGVLLAVEQVLLEAQLAQPLHQHRPRRLGSHRVAGAVFEVVHIAAELVQRAHRLGRERRADRFLEQRLEQAHPPLAGEVAQGRQRRVADAALRGGDRAQEGRVVVLVDQQPQPGAQVLDLGAVEEALAAGDLVRDLRLAQRLFQLAALVVGAVEDGEVAPLGRAGVLARGVGADRQDARGRPLGLVLLLVALDHLDRLALAELAPELLLEDLRVQRDDVVRGGQDRAGGAVVLLQRDDLEVRIVLRQALEVLDGGAAPAVDALVVVAHRGEDPLLAHQGLEQLVLGRVGVLVFIDQHMAQRAAPFLAGLLVLLQQLQRQADQVVEVHRRIGREPLLVELHHPGGDALVVVLRGGLGLLAAQAVVLPQADGPLPAPRHRRVGGAAGVLQHAQHVVGVQDRELRLQAEHLAVLAQHAHAQAVEGGDHQILRRPRAHQRARPLAHFLRRLVGEGDRADLLRGEAGLQQPGDLVRDHPRLA